MRNDRYFEVDMKLYLGDIWEIIDAEYNKVLVEQYGKQLETSQPDYTKYQSDFQNYQAKLDDYRGKAQVYQQQLEAYYAQNSSKLSMNYPAAQQYQTQYTQYQGEVKGYTTKHQGYQKDLDRYKKELQDYMDKYRAYYEQYKKLHGMYANEADAALMPGPPVPPSLAFSGIGRPGMPEVPKVPQRFVPEWANKHISAKGIGAYPKNMEDAQGMAMAQRAAQVDAYRLLSENAMGVKLSSETTVQDFVAQSDVISARVKDSYIRGAQVVNTRDVRQDRYFEVEMKLYLGYMWEIIDAAYNKVLMDDYGKKLEQYQPDQVRYKNEIEAYEAVLREFKGKYQGYQEKLDAYYREQRARLSLNLPVPQKYNSLYQKYRTQTGELDAQYKKFMGDFDAYQKEMARQRAEYEKYQKECERLRAAYNNESNAALMPPPPMPPSLSFAGPSAGDMPQLPKVPPRFIQIGRAHV